MIFLACVCILFYLVTSAVGFKDDLKQWGVGLILVSMFCRLALIFLILANWVPAITFLPRWFAYLLLCPAVVWQIMELRFDGKVIDADEEVSGGKKALLKWSALAVALRFALPALYLAIRGTLHFAN